MSGRRRRCRTAPLDGDTTLVEPLDGPDEDGSGGEGNVVVDLGVGDAEVVVDDGVDIGHAHQRVPPLVARLVWGDGPVAVTLLATDVAPAPAVGDVAELLHIDVEH